eukprot:1141214-Pelagomonas_calceolata.AAC.6
MLAGLSAVSPAFKTHDAGGHEDQVRLTRQHVHDLMAWLAEQEVHGLQQVGQVDGQFWNVAGR